MRSRDFFAQGLSHVEQRVRNHFQREPQLPLEDDYGNGPAAKGSPARFYFDFKIGGIQGICVAKPINQRDAELTPTMAITVQRNAVSTSGELRIGAIEAGGTKMVCALGRDWKEVRDAPKFIVGTKSPRETAVKVLDWFEMRHQEEPLSAIGIGSFGPIELGTKSIGSTTPKTAWRGFNWHNVIEEKLGDLPIGFDTDTNAAVLAEWRWGSAMGRNVAAYVTVGTGIGGGLLVNGVLVHGLLHPEIGHMFVPRQRDDNFPGVCPSHGDCLEGLASGPAVAKRWGRPSARLSSNHPAWELESDYLSLAIANLVTTTSPEVIVLGGGVMEVEGLLERIRRKTVQRLAGYIARDELGQRIEDYLVAPGLSGASGVIGAYALGTAAQLASTKR